MKYLVVSIFFVITAMAGLVYAASPEDCAMIKASHRNAPCDASTPQSLIDEVKKLGFTQSVAGARKYILSVVSIKGRRSGAPADCNGRSTRNVDELNPAFAVCAAQFLQAYNKTYGAKSVTVRNAFRPPRNLGDGCGSNSDAGGSPSSRHMKGEALDINPQGSTFFGYRRLRAFTRANPQFAVCFPYKMSGKGFIDKPHLAFAGAQSGEGGKCRAQGMQPLCKGAVNIPIQRPSIADISRQGQYQSNNPGQGGQSDQQGARPQLPKPPSGGAPQGSPQGNSSSKTGDGYNPYSNRGDGKRDAAGESVSTTNVARITCDPGEISGTERSLIEWSCGGQSTRSRGATSRLQGRFNTRGNLTGKGYARPGSDTSYKIQCLDGDKVIGEAICKVQVGTGSTNNSTGIPTGKPVMHLSAEHQRVGWAGSTTLQWATINANNCTLKGGKVNEQGSSGSVDTGRLYRSTPYALRCDTASGSKLTKIEIKIW